jgi:hypothetical protein
MVACVAAVEEKNWGENMLVVIIIHIVDQEVDG